MSAGRVRGARIAAVLLGTAMVALVGAAPAAAQTAHHRFEAFPGGAVSEIYLDEAALGAQNMLEVLKWHVPNVIVTRDRLGRPRLMIRHDCAQDPESAEPFDENAAPPSPLLIVDGVQIANPSFMAELLGLNPFRVEKITVLRDVASTSVYGSRAACGVILVTTRR